MKTKLIVVSILVLVSLAVSVTWWFNQRNQRVLADRLAAQCRRSADAKAWSSLEEFAKQLEKIPGKQTDGLLWQAEAFQQRGQFSKAASCLKEIPQSDERWERAMAELVDLYLGPMSAPLMAQELCGAVIRHNPSNWRARQRLIYILAMTFQHSELRSQLKEAIHHPEASNEVFIYYCLGDALQFTDGGFVTGRWFETNSDSEVISVARAIHSSKATPEKGSDEGNKETNPSISRLELPPAIEYCYGKYPQNLEIKIYLMNQAKALGDPSVAKQLMAGIDLNAAADDRLWRIQGWLESTAGNLAAAEASYLRALENNPLDWRSRFMLVELLRRTGTKDEKASRLAVDGKLIERQLLELKSASSYPAELLNRLAEYLVACGDSQAAIAFTGRCERVAPSERN